MGCLSRFLHSEDFSQPNTASPKPSKRWSPTHTQGSVTRPSRVVLPPELVLHIFSLVASSSPSAAVSLALVCSQLRDRVRLALYTAAVLHSPRQVSLFIRSVKKNAHLAELVKRLEVDGGATWPLTTRLPKILEACSRLTELTVRSTTVFSLTDFGSSRHLKHLTLVDCTLSDRTTTSRYHAFLAPLPSLESLSLHQVRFDTSTAEHFLCPNILPRVIALELNGCRLIDEPGHLRDLGPYEPEKLAEQLELLRIYGEPEPAADEDGTRPQHANQTDPFDLIAKCNNLRSLALPVVALSAHILDDLPTEHLTHISILPPLHGQEDVLELQLSAANALSTSFLTLAAHSTSASTSLSTSPWNTSRSPISLTLGASYSSPATPTALSPFTSPLPSPTHGTRLPLSQLIELALPESWNIEAESAWKANGEFTWAVGRIGRECDKREVEVRYDEAETKVGREMVGELARVRRAVQGQ
ncbi:hypothetical protein JCM8547_003055 [Rhodosporidiobolus lusitaniae]